jgi:hypothetical protein
MVPNFFLIGRYGFQKIRKMKKNTFSTLVLSIFFNQLQTVGNLKSKKIQKLTSPNAEGFQQKRLHGAGYRPCQRWQ